MNLEYKWDIWHVPYGWKCISKQVTLCSSASVPSLVVLFWGMSKRFNTNPRGKSSTLKASSQMRLRFHGSSYNLIWAFSFYVFILVWITNWFIFNDFLSTKKNKYNRSVYPSKLCEIQWNMNTKIETKEPFHMSKIAKLLSQMTINDDFLHIIVFIPWMKCLRKKKYTTSQIFQNSNRR